MKITETNLSLLNMKKLRIEQLLSLVYISLTRQRFFGFLKVNERIALLINYKNTLKVLISCSMNRNSNRKKIQKLVWFKIEAHHWLKTWLLSIKTDLIEKFLKLTKNEQSVGFYLISKNLRKVTENLEEKSNNGTFQTTRVLNSKL